MNRFLLVFALFIAVQIPISLVEARQGCCSRHGGVCGCECCDGTPLSAKCAPYYPDCNGKSEKPQEPVSNQGLAKDTLSKSALIADTTKNVSCEYWISKSGVRHNSNCRWFKACAGTGGTASDGRPCKKCKG